MRGDLEDYARARVGTTVNKKYRLLRLIGAGGMASVYEAVHRNANRVAIKMLHPHLSIDADLRARFLREGYAANTVSHRGAVRVLDDDIAEDRSVFLVMELLEGETLDSLCKRSSGRLGEREVCELASQLLDVLGAAHEKGIVHRDVKPENLFLTCDGVLKVLDFGIARLLEGNAAQHATRTGRMIGTPAFMPPEQALGRSREIDGKADIYAVGATMFSLLSGTFVHDAETVEEMLILSGSKPARSVRTVVPHLARPLAEVVDRALAFRREDRWGSAGAMGRALEQAATSTFGSTAWRVGLRGHPASPKSAPTSGEATQNIPPHVLFPSTAPDATLGSGTEISPSPGPPAAAGASTTGGVASARIVGGRHPRRTREGQRANVPPWAMWTGVAAFAAVAGVAWMLTRQFGGTQAGPGRYEANGSSGVVPTGPPIGTVTRRPTESSVSDGLPNSERRQLEAGGVPRAEVVAPPREANSHSSGSSAPREAPTPPRLLPKPAATVNCDPPYTVLPDGRYQPKPECI